MLKSEWLETATKFDMGKCPVTNRNVIIEAVSKKDGNPLWVLKTENQLLGKDGKLSDHHRNILHDENRDNILWDSCGDAWNAWLALDKSMVVSYTQNLSNGITLIFESDNDTTAMEQTNAEAAQLGLDVVGELEELDCSIPQE